MNSTQTSAFVADIRTKAAKEYGVRYPKQTIRAALTLLDHSNPQEIIEQVAGARQAVQIIYKLAAQALAEGKSVEILGRTIEAVPNV